MDMSAVDPYKQQLGALFESFDVNKVGSLDYRGLEQLCEQLPLDQSQCAELVSAVFQNASSRVNFSQFWDGLITLLGGGRSPSCPPGSTRESGKDKDLNPNRGESPEREVSPKLVLGQKKYGRRSRPESSELEFDAAVPDSDSNIAVSVVEEISHVQKCLSVDPESDGEDTDNFSAKKRRTTESHEDFLKDLPHLSNAPASLGSFSQAEDCLKQAWNEFGKNGFVNQVQLAQVCERIGTEKLSSEAVQQLFDQLDADRDGRVSLDDFLHVFRSGVPCTPTVSLGAQVSWVVGNSLGGGASLSLTELNGVAVATAEAIIEMWDSVGVLNPSALLRDLNLDDALRPLSVSSVAGAIEEEVLRQGKTGSGSEDSTLSNTVETPLDTNNLLLAALTLRQAEVRWMRSSMEQMSCERDKLRNDLSEANYRASLLAQEIDEHHSKMEKVSQNQFKLLEQKHSEALKDLSTRFSQEREQLAQQNNRLELKVASLLQSESKLASEATSLRLENETLEKESRTLAERVSECEEAKLQMGKELQEIENLQQRLNELQANQDQDRMEHLCEQITKLRAENSSLRDRNDELTVELEVLTTRLSNMRVRRQASSSVDGGLKRRGNSPLSVAPTDDSGEEDSPRVGKVRRFSQKGDISLDNVHIEGLQIHPLGTSESGVEADIDVDSSENLSVCSLKKLCAKKSFMDGDQWLNITSESSSLVGSQDDLINLPDCDCKKDVGQNVDVARLKARIVELETALHLHTSKSGGNQNANCQSDLKEMELESKFLSNEDSPPSSSKAFQNESDICGKNIIQQCLSQQTESSNGQAVEQLQQHCRDLETQLDNVKVQIIKILSEKRACTQENCILKKRISDLSNQLPCSPVEVGSLLGSASTSCHELDPMDNEDSTDCQQLCTKMSEVMCSSDDCDKLQVTSDRVKTLEDKIKTMEAVHSKELQALRDQCSDMEKSLTMMRDEYERCEDYWAGKLDEERQLAEQEQQITDEKFSELMAKIREYEELFADDHMRRSSKSTDGRLETIEEQDALEKQVLELEEELEDVRRLAETKLIEKESETQKLRDQLHLLQHCSIPQNLSGMDIAVQVSDLETGSCGSDRTFIVKRSTTQIEGVPNMPALNGDITDHGVSSTPSTSSSSGSSSMCSEDSIRNVPSGAVRNHQSHGRHRRMRHHPHYIALNCLNPEDELQAVALRLHEQEQTCVRLQKALRAQQQQTQALLQHSWDRHKQEVADLQVVLQCTTEKLEQQGEICHDQMNRLTRSDILVKELYVENAHLLAAIQNLEERCLLLLQQQNSITGSENCSSV